MVLLSEPFPAQSKKLLLEWYLLTVSSGNWGPSSSLFLKGSYLLDNRISHLLWGLLYLPTGTEPFLLCEFKKSLLTGFWKFLWDLWVHFPLKNHFQVRSLDILPCYSLGIKLWFSSFHRFIFSIVLIRSISIRGLLPASKTNMGFRINSAHIILFSLHHFVFMFFPF